MSEEIKKYDKKGNLIYYKKIIFLNLNISIMKKVI